MNTRNFPSTDREEFLYIATMHEINRPLSETFTHPIFRFTKQKCGIFFNLFRIASESQLIV